MLALRARRRPAAAAAAVPALVAFLLTNKVFSPQYVDLAAAAGGARPAALAAVPASGRRPRRLCCSPASTSSSATTGRARASAYGWFLTAVLLRDLALLVYSACVVRDVLRPEHDVVRTDPVTGLPTGEDDPAGGVLDGAPDARPARRGRAPDAREPAREPVRRVTRARDATGHARPRPARARLAARVAGVRSRSGCQRGWRARADARRRRARCRTAPARAGRAVRSRAGTSWDVDLFRKVAEFGYTATPSTTPTRHRGLLPGLPAGAARGAPRRARLDRRRAARLAGGGGRRSGRARPARRARRASRPDRAVLVPGAVALRGVPRRRLLRVAVARLRRCRAGAARGAAAGRAPGCSSPAPAPSGSAGCSSPPALVVRVAVTGRPAAAATPAGCCCRRSPWFGYAGYLHALTGDRLRWCHAQERGLGPPADRALGRLRAHAALARGHRACPRSTPSPTPPRSSRCSSASRWPGAAAAAALGRGDLRRAVGRRRSRLDHLPVGVARDAAVVPAVAAARPRRRRAGRGSPPATWRCPRRSWSCSP